MAERLMSCPVCGSELFISERAIYCSNPKCNYSSNISSTQRLHKKDYTIFLPFAFTLIAIGLMIFYAANVFFIFIPFIFPIPILRKIKRRIKPSKSKSDE